MGLPSGLLQPISCALQMQKYLEVSGSDDGNQRKEVGKEISDLIRCMTCDISGIRLFPLSLAILCRTPQMLRQFALI